MERKDGFNEATMAPLKRPVAPQANKEFGQGMDDRESTNAKLSHSTAKVSGPTNPAKGSNDIAHAGTVAPLKDGDTIVANRPSAWPRGFQK